MSLLLYSVSQQLKWWNLSALLIKVDSEEQSPCLRNSSLFVNFGPITTVKALLSIWISCGCHGLWRLGILVMAFHYSKAAISSTSTSMDALDILIQIWVSRLHILAGLIWNVINMCSWDARQLSTQGLSYEGGGWVCWVHEDPFSFKSSIALILMLTLNPNSRISGI